MSKRPVRLIDDPGAPASLRANLGRVQKAPSAYDPSRGLARLQAEFVRQAATAATTATTGQPAESLLHQAARGPAAKPLLWSSLGVIGAVAIAAVVGIQLQRPRPSSRSATAARSAAVPPPLAAAPDAGARPPDAAVPPADLAVPTAARREIEQLLQIRELLAHNPAAAYRLAQSAEREFPNGALREEREGLMALALYRMGERERGRSRARAFLLRHPRSPLRASLERLLADKNP